MALEIRDWLQFEIKPVQSVLFKFYIFGSIVTGANNPNDCDVFIVSHPNCGQEQRIKVRDKIDEIKTAFLVRFSLPLSVITLTFGEWIEFQDFFGVDHIAVLDM